MLKAGAFSPNYPLQFVPIRRAVLPSRPRSRAGAWPEGCIAPAWRVWPYRASLSFEA